MSADVTQETLRAAINAELRKLPKYWTRVAEKPMERSAQTVFVADVERAIDRVFAALSDPPTTPPHVVSKDKVQLLEIGMMVGQALGIDGDLPLREGIAMLIQCAKLPAPPQETGDEKTKSKS